MPNIAIVWDFDGTLTPQDSTTLVVEFLEGGGAKEFWPYVKGLRGDQKRPRWEHVLASDAPIWMYALSRIAFKRKVPLNAEFFSKFIAPQIKLYDEVATFLRKLRLLTERKAFKDVDLKIHFFVITAGLKELVELAFPSDLITWTFGCCYKIIAAEGNEAEPESVPVFCMDETMKTRSLFEISKGSFLNPNASVNKRVAKENLWAPFENVVYVGDGDTDVPALSLVRSLGGLGIAVYDPKKSQADIDKKLKDLRLDMRTDLITAADFSEGSELYSYLEFRCKQICYRYRAALAG